MTKLKRIFILLVCVLVAFWTTGKIVKLIYPVAYQSYVARYAEEYNLSEPFVFAVIKTESNFKRQATSNKNAQGLMQIMEPTGQWIADQLGMADFSSASLQDPETNIKMGCFYLSYLLERYDGNKKCALAAYNAGHANVDSWLLRKEYAKNGKDLQVIPFPETEKYVNLVLKNETIYAYLYKK